MCTNALYLWYDNEKLMGMLVSHVDDFAFCGNNKFHNTVIKELKNTFNISTHESGTFKYLGMNVNQDRNGVVIYQDNYIPSLTPISIPKERYTKRDENKTDKLKHWSTWRRGLQNTRQTRQWQLLMFCLSVPDSRGS